MSRVIDDDGIFVPAVISTDSVGKGRASASEVSNISSSPGGLRLMLGRFASERAPVLSSLRSSVGLGPRLPFVGEEETIEEGSVVVGPLTPVAY